MRIYTHRITASVVPLQNCVNSVLDFGNSVFLPYRMFHIFKAIFFLNLLFNVSI